MWLHYKLERYKYQEKASIEKDMRQLEYESSNLKIELFFFINSIKLINNLILNKNIIILLMLNTKYDKNGFNFKKDKSKKQ